MKCTNENILQLRTLALVVTSVQDGLIEFDLRSCVKSSKSDVKDQPEWAEAIYQILINKRSNIQIGVRMHFSYECPISGSH